MADEDKTEEPTAKKKTESFSSGQFAKAPEINTAMVLFATVIIFAVLTPRKSKDIMLFTESILGHLHEIEVTRDGVVSTLLSMGKFVVAFVMPLVIVSFLMSFIAEGFKPDFVLHSKPLVLNGSGSILLTDLSGFW